MENQNITVFPARKISSGTIAGVMVQQSLMPSSTQYILCWFILPT